MIDDHPFFFIGWMITFGGNLELDRLKWTDHHKLLGFLIIIFILYCMNLEVHTCLL